MYPGTSFKILLSAILLLMASSCLMAAVALRLPIQFTIENGNYAQSIITIKKNGETVNTFQGNRNSNLKLEYGNEYMLLFSKPGYITKSIRVNTSVPMERTENGFEPYKIGVRLFKQYEGVNIVIYNQPVAFIRFHNELDEFGYDVDYTKSILSILSFTEDVLAKKAEEERLSLKHAGIKFKSDPKEPAPSLSVQKINPAPVVEHPIPERVTVAVIPPPVSLTQANPELETPSVTSEHSKVNSPLSDSENKIQLNQGAENIPIPAPVAASEENKNFADVESGNDTPSGSSNTNGDDVPKTVLLKDAGADFPVTNAVETPTPSITTEHLVEANRTITIFHISDGKQSVDIKKVNYNWGGVFYFKDRNLSISENLFQWYLQGK
ncbi:hypothetical protein BH11BAC2_BH11BAC2_01510 [soil metagenome]